MELTSECDGSLRQFGEKFWTELASRSDALQASLTGSSPLVRVEYSDCYISSPWSLMLLAEVMAGLKKLSGSNWIKPKLGLTTAEKIPNQYARGVYAEWRDNNTQSAVIREYFRSMDEAIGVSIKPVKTIPHGRRFSLTREDGSVTYIRLDHGFGCWGVNGRPSKRLFRRVMSMKIIRLI